MKLKAISDLHLASLVNRDALAAIPSFGDDGLIIAGDVAERFDHMRLAFETFTQRFAKVFWVPGNHDLWAISGEANRAAPVGEERYRTLVELAREYGIVTPEDPYEVWTGAGGHCVIAPLFLHYDYSFRPDHIGREDVVAWAREEGAVCADEVFLSPAPWPTPDAWCAQRVEETEKRLSQVAGDLPTILVNHYPLRADLIDIPRAPRFTPWCGTKRTEDWHRRFRAKVVVSGHLHVRRTDWRDDTRFEEVSLGYPRQWDQRKGIAPYFRDILPEGPPSQELASWRR